MAKEKLVSEGKCAYCEQTIKKSAMSKHLNKHLEDLATAKPSRERAFHVRVEAEEYFLNLLPHWGI